MKTLRSVKHRGFTIDPAGYFNVLTPGKRFTSSLPPGDFHYLPHQSNGTAPGSPATTPQFESISVPDQKYLGQKRLLRPVFIALGATALTLFFVWWSAGCPIHVIF
jgi:hypothetical protein